VAGSRYRIVLRGRLSESFESVFDGMTLEHGPNRTVLTGDVRDQAQLYGLIDRLQEFGIELLAVEPADGSGTGCEPGAGPAVSGLRTDGLDLKIITICYSRITLSFEPSAD
jgi:hypothetical protein